MDAQECRRHMKAVIDSVAQYRLQRDDVEVDVIDANGHAQVIHRGWNGDERVYVVLVHLRLVENRIYVERDGTSDGVATHLLNAGVPHAQTVMAVHPPYLRHLTAFAIS